MNFRIHVTLADTAGNQLIVLTTEIQNDNHLSLHVCSSYDLYFDTPPDEKSGSS